MATHLPKCANCGEHAAHYVMPHLDAPGYYTCATLIEPDSARFSYLALHLPRWLWYYITTRDGRRLGDVVGGGMPGDLRAAVDAAAITARCADCGGVPGDHSDDCTKGDLAIQLPNHD